MNKISPPDLKIAYNYSEKGTWLLVIGYWLLVIGYWLLVIGYWLLVIGYCITPQFIIACIMIFVFSFEYFMATFLFYIK